MKFIAMYIIIGLILWLVDTILHYYGKNPIVKMQFDKYFVSYVLILNVVAWPIMLISHILHFIDILLVKYADWLYGQADDREDSRGDRRDL